MTSTRRHATTPLRRTAAAAGALVLTAALAGCGGGSGGASTSSSGSSAGSAAKAAAPQPAGELAPGSPPSGARAAAGGTGTSDASGAGSTGAGTTVNSGTVLPTDREVVYRGSISVQVKDVGAAAARAEALATGAGGLVGAAQTQTDPRHPRFGQATLTLRVPPAAFGPTLDDLGRLGRELDRQRSAEDVTSQVIDVDSRVRTQQRSVDRVRVLLSRARTIGEVVQVESELSRREADLESLEAQLKGLKDLTGLATIEVTLTSPSTHLAPRTKHEDSLGFLSGLRGGWDAFVAVVAVALTVVGALVPFVVALAVIGVPLLLVWRTRRRTALVTPPTTPSA